MAFFAISIKIVQLKWNKKKYILNSALYGAQPWLRCFLANMGKTT